MTRYCTNSIHLPHPKTPFPYCKLLGRGLKALLFVINYSVFSIKQQLNF